MLVHRSNLEVGDIVAAPRFILDENGNRESLADMWGEETVPTQFTVKLWDWHDSGETNLVAADGTSIDSNVLDYPTLFDVLNFVAAPECPE